MLGDLTTKQYYMNLLYHANYTNLKNTKRLELRDFVCLFGVFRPTREFFTYMETSPLPMNGYKFLHFDPYSALMAIEQ